MADLHDAASFPDQSINARSDLISPCPAFFWELQKVTGHVGH